MMTTQSSDPSSVPQDHPSRPQSDEVANHARDDANAANDDEHKRMPVNNSDVETRVDSPPSPTIDLSSHLNLTNPLRMKLDHGIASAAADHGEDTASWSVIDQEIGTPIHAVSVQPQHHRPRRHRSRSSSIEEEYDDFSFDSPTRSSHSSRTLNPSILFRARARLLLTMLSVALVTSDALLGLSSFHRRGGKGCGELAMFVSIHALIVAVAAICYHYIATIQVKRWRRKHRRWQATRHDSSIDASESSFNAKSSARLRSLYRVLLVLLLVSSFYSFNACHWLDERSGGCATDRSLRQVALFNIILSLCILALTGVYKLLQEVSPSIRKRLLSEKPMKSFIIMIALCAFIINIVQNASHNAEGLVPYHWGFTERPPCPISCRAPPVLEGRATACLDRFGREVEEQHCTNTYLAEYRPTALHHMLAPCPRLPFDECHAAAAAARDRDRDGRGGRTPQVNFPPPYLVPVFDQNCPQQCVEYPEDEGGGGGGGYQYPGHLDTIVIPIRCWDEQVAFMNREQDGTDATGWVSMEQCTRGRGPSAEEEIIAFCPPRPCPAFCDPLKTSSILYSVLYALTIVLLLVSLFRHRLSRTRLVRKLAGWMHWSLDGSSSADASMRHTDSTSVDASTSSTSSPPSSLPPPERARFTVDDSMEEHEMAVASPPASSSSSTRTEPTPPSSYSSSTDRDLPSIWHSLRLGCRALFLSSDRWRHLREWWRHILFLFFTLVLTLLCLHSLLNLLWLIQQLHCRDFTIAASVNAAASFAVFVALGAIAASQEVQARMVRKDENPFEAIGLLDDDEEEDGAAEDGGAVAIEDQDDNDTDEFAYAAGEIELADDTDADHDEFDHQLDYAGGDHDHGSESVPAATRTE